MEPYIAHGCASTERDTVHSGDSMEHGTDHSGASMSMEHGTATVVRVWNIVLTTV
jgi:hypothetical protein